MRRGGRCGGGRRSWPASCCCFPCCTFVLYHGPWGHRPRHRVGMLPRPMRAQRQALNPQHPPLVGSGRRHSHRPLPWAAEAGPPKLCGAARWCRRSGKPSPLTLCPVPWPALPRQGGPRSISTSCRRVSTRSGYGGGGGLARRQGQGGWGVREGKCSLMQLAGCRHGRAGGPPPSAGWLPAVHAAHVVAGMRLHRHLQVPYP